MMVLSIFCNVVFGFTEGSFPEPEANASWRALARKRLGTPAMYYSVSNKEVASLPVL